MSDAATRLERPLRVALIWNGALQQEHLVEAQRDVVLGSGAAALFNLPEGAIATEDVTVLQPSGQGFALSPVQGMGGYLWQGGRPTPVGDLPGALPFTVGDFGLVTFGTVSVFFQHVRAVAGPPPRRSRRDGGLISSMSLSWFLHALVLLFLFVVAAEELAPTAALELDSELFRKFMVTPPPEDVAALLRARSADALEDPGLRDRDDSTGKRAKDDEGKVGKRDSTRDRTEVSGTPADAIAAQVRGMGLLGVLSGGGKNAVSDALRAPSLDSLLGGMGAAQTLIGRGSDGLGLRGGASGGGGQSSGALFGAGELGTSVGGGKGLGAGKDGPGTRGREAREAQLSLDASEARVSGFLSREQINRVVQANRAAIKYCFETALQRAPKLQGGIHVQWRIDRKGIVSTARVAKSTLGDAGVEGCIVRQVKRWKFPEPDGGEVDVVYPFLFRAQ